MADALWPQPYTTWRCEGTGSLYTVLGVARVCTDGPREGDFEVVYVSHTHQRLCTRDLDQFMDGRFKEVASRG